MNSRDHLSALSALSTLSTLSTLSALSALSTLALTLSVFTSSGCSSAPPAQPRQRTLTWAETLRADQVKPNTRPPKSTRVTHELWGSFSATPSLERVEATLAETGVVAETTGVNGQYNASVGQGECDAVWGTLSDSDRAVRAARSRVCGAQLNESQRARLESATHRVIVSCQGLNGGGLIDLHNIATGFAKAARAPLVEEGELPSADTIAPVWVETSQMRCGELSKLNTYSSAQHVLARRHELKDDTWAVRTHGLKTFGLPEIALLLVRTSDLDYAEASVIARADFAIRFEGAAEGQEASSGSSTGIYVKMKRIITHMPSLKTLLNHETLREALVIVNPQAEVDDVDALVRISGRFSIP